MRISPLHAILLLPLLGACSDDDKVEPAPPVEAPSTEAPATPEAPAATAADLPKGLLVGYAQFTEGSRPGAALAELIYRRGGEWHVDSFEDASSNVFHKVMPYAPLAGQEGILTLGGNAAAVKWWTRGDDGQLTSQTLWTEAFGGAHNRMRDAEVADLYGDGKPTIAVATHDQGVLAVLRPGATPGTAEVVKLDHEADTFIHEIEIGDLNDDGVLEVYATPSEPNRVGANVEQSGHVVRYTPKTGEGRTVVADLGNRHAKEIYVGDVDGDGKDELYVAVEALTRGTGASLEIVEPVEIRRYDADTAPTARVVIATLQDRFCRFLTVGDVDGDGKREMVAASFRSGLWLLRPGQDPRAAWTTQLIDSNSSGFEHAALLADLDGDRKDELYVASDDQGELRRYVFRDGAFHKEVILRRDNPSQRMTWNLTVAPVALLAPAAK